MWQAGMRKGNMEFLRSSLSVCQRSSRSCFGVDSSSLLLSSRCVSVISNNNNNNNNNLVLGCSKSFSSTVRFPSFSSSSSHSFGGKQQQQQQQQKYQQQRQQFHTSVAVLDDDEERSSRFRDMWKGLKGGEEQTQPEPPLTPPEHTTTTDSPLDAFLSSIKAHNNNNNNNNNNNDQQFPRKTPRELKKEQQEQEKREQEEEGIFGGRGGGLGEGPLKPLYSPSSQGEVSGFGGVGEGMEGKSLREQQKEFEREVVEKAMVDYRETVEQMRGMEKAASLKPGQRLMLLWYIPLLGKIKQEIAVMTSQLESKAHTIARHAPLFIMLGPEKLAVITLHSVLGKLFGQETGKGSLSTILVKLADLLEAELNMERIAKQNPKAASALVRRNKRIDRLLNRTNQILEKEKESKKERLSLQAAAVLVDFLVRTSTADIDESGKVIMDRGLISQAQKKTSRRPVKDHLFQLGLDYLLQQSEPDQGGVYFEEPSDLFGEELTEDDREDMEIKTIKAFKVKHIKQRNATKSILELDERVLEMTEASFLALESSLARHLPMVVPPRPWTNPHTGGYLLYPGRLVRPVGSILQNDTVEAATKDMRDLYEVITILGKTPWKINTFILDVVEELWKRGGGQGEIPSAQNIPLPDSSLLEEKGEGAYYRSLNKVKQQNYDLHGLRCTLQYKLEIARRFKNYENIYFPHNLDFRGRAYPIPPHFNHLGPDIDRGLLLFARSRPLGDKGLFWMKVHLANLFGFNKASFLERIAWTEKHLPQALDSAANPLDGGQWWLEAEDPWQALATCRELREILSLPPDKRKSYESSLPVHMDGSCNGLQHYAALGGDVEGGTQVNLVPGDRPGDVYSSVSNIVARKVAEDARNGHELAQILDGKIERKIVKQTVMTSVYGVTFVGARKQIENQLTDRVQIDEELYWGASAYLAKLTFASLGELFFGARQLMEWLGQCASLIAKSGEPVVFTTPFNLPVMQPYRQTRKAQIQTVLQRITMIQSSDDFPINTQKQKSAFPPNYVHSLDSTHMLLTARDMYKAKLDFSAVHDSYWSHACDVEVMNKYIRKNFIELHEQPLLENLLEEFQQRNPGIDFPPIPPRGNLDLKVVMDSPYFFH